MSTLLKHTAPYVNLTNLVNDGQGNLVMDDRSIAVLFVTPADNLVVSFPNVENALAAVTALNDKQLNGAFAIPLFVVPTP